METGFETLQRTLHQARTYLAQTSHLPQNAEHVAKLQKRLEEVVCELPDEAHAFHSALDTAMYEKKGCRSGVVQPNYDRYVLSQFVTRLLLECNRWQLVR